MIKKLAIAIGVCALSLFAQTNSGMPVNQVAGPPPEPIQTIYDYSGSNIIYIGYAFSDQKQPVNIVVSTVSRGNPASFTTAAHGFDYQSAATTTPTICVTGATGDWAGLNGCWVATPTSSSAFTINLDTSGYASAFTGQVITVQTKAPRITSAVWAIRHYVYSGNNLIWSGWASLPIGAATTSTVTSASTAMQYIWNNRTNLSYQ